MPSSYTSLLGFVQPATGELTNTWGSTVNSQLTQLVEDSIASTSSKDITAADWTLSTTGGGQSNEARTAVLLVTGTPGTTRSIFAPKQSKVYVVVNNSNSSVVLKGGPVSPTTGVTVLTGVTSLIAWNTNTSDFVVIASGVTSLTASTGINVSSSTGAVTVTNTGVTSAVAGTGIGVSAGTGDVTFTNSGVTSNVAGTGIGVSGPTGAVTITNSGVTSNVAGTGISVSGSTGAVTITNSGVTSAVAGTGISVSGSTGAVTFTNSGVTSLTAGTNISLSGSTGGVTVNATAAGSTTQLQYNNAGSLGGTSGMTWSGTALTAPLATGSTAITQAEKTSSTTLATTAFVDRLRSLTTPTTTSSGGTLVVGDRGSLVSVTAGVTIPASVFAAQDVVTIYNNSASTITITQGTSLTLRQVGTSNTGNRSLALRGMATVVFISATEAVISGGGLS